MGQSMPRIQTARIFTPALAVALALLFSMTLGAGQAHANYTYKHLASAKGTMVVSMDKQDTPGICFWSRHSSMPAAVKVGNPKLVKVSVTPGTIELVAKRPGTTTISYRWNCKKHTVRIKVVKYQNPVASFKIGSKQYKSRYARGTTVDFGNAKSKKWPGAVNVQAAQNWRIVKITVTGKGYDAKKIRNGSKLPANTYVLAVTLQNTKTKCVETLNMFWDGYLGD